MKINKFNTIILLGLIAIVGILIAQLLWTRQAYSLEEKKFSQKAHIALLETAKKLYEGTTDEIPAENPVQKISNDYYIVNVENDFEPEILEYYLKAEFEKINLETDFEYAMYNCESDKMVYGNYVSQFPDQLEKRTVYFPKHHKLVYYFAVRFPNETTYLFSSLKFWFVLSFALVIVLIVYVYSIFTIIQQKKYSELQRDFINNMTHEFKTPLSSILIASNYINRHPSITGDERLKKYSEIIIAQSSKLNNHIEQILTVAKSDSQAMKLNRENISLLATINAVRDDIMLKRDDITVNIICPSDYTIFADPFHFSNLLYNLFDNAVKYSVGAPIIDVSVLEEKSALILQVSDHGIGVQEENINFIFDRFFRIAGPQSTEKNGFGLGLYYVRRICKMHGWKITAESQKDKGLTILITIPHEPL